MISHILIEIVTYLPTYKFLDWIDRGLIDYEVLSQNPSPGAFNLLMQNKNKISWSWLAGNPNPDAVKAIIKWNGFNQNHINWSWLSGNTHPDAVKLLMQHESYIYLHSLSMNPSADVFGFIEKNWNKFDLCGLSANPNPDIVKKIATLDIVWASMNPNSDVVQKLISNKKYVDWNFLSSNPNPDAFKLLMEEPNRINWNRLSNNPNPDAIELLSKNRENINWVIISKNPGIFMITFNTELLSKFE
jgi:hypothetical protein